MNPAAPAPGPRRASLRLGLSTLQSRIVIATVVALGLGLSAWFAQRARRAENARINESFRSLTSYQTAANNERVRLLAEILKGLRRGIAYQPDLSREAFEGMCFEILAAYEGFQSLQWVQQVEAADRPAVERQMRADYGYPIEFKWRTEADGFRNAEPRDNYRVIRFATPLESNAIVLGYDVQTAPTAVFQDRAIETRDMVVTAPFRLAQSTAENEELGIIFILPVFWPGEGETPLRGFVQGVFRASGIFEPSVLPENREHAIYRYFDQTDSAENPVLLLSTDRRGGNTRFEHPPVTPGAPPPRFEQQVISIGGREWLFVAQARPEWISSLGNHQSELIIGGGFTTTLLAAFLLLGFFRRSRWVNQLVAERTQALLTQQGELQAILDHSPNAIWIKDLTGRYILANRELEQIYNRPLDTVLGATDDLFYPAEVAAEMRAADERALRSDSHILIDGKYDIGGEERHYYTVKFPVRRENGEVFGVGGIATDVTTFKRVEAQLAETQKLESLGVLAGGIAHDFNNLLTGMLGNASLIAHGLPPENDISESAREIETAARRAAELCRQMLAYSGRGKFVIERLDLSKAVEELVPLVKSSIGSKAVLNLCLASDLPPVDVDPSQLRQIIMNLVINAAEAQPPEGGPVFVTTSSRQVDAATLSQGVGHPDLRSGPYVSFVVEDHGHGMDTDTLRRIFEPFFTTKFTGRGLGLSAVLGIVRSHQGALLVDSKPGAGTTFELLLPAAEGDLDHRLDTALPPSALPPMQGLRLFLVEDEPTVYKLVSRVLVQAGAQVTAYQDGAQAAAEFDPSKFDLAVLDLTVPGLSGRDVFHRLRALQPDLPVLLISGYTEQEAADQFSDVRPSGFLQKPFTSRELIRAIDTIRDDAI